MALALPAPEIAWPIFVVLVLEWVVWPVVMSFLPNAPQCPICKNPFRWSEIDAPGSADKNVFLIDLDNSKLTRLAEPKERIFRISCSPDGNYAVARNIDGNKLMLYEFSTQKWSDLLSHNVGMEQWSADSKYVFFDTGTGAEQAIYRIRLTDHKLEQVASLQNFRRTVLPWVSWMGLTPDGSPPLMRDIGSQEVYALDFDAP